MSHRGKHELLHFPRAGFKTSEAQYDSLIHRGIRIRCLNSQVLPYERYSSMKLTRFGGAHTTGIEVPIMQI